MGFVTLGLPDAILMSSVTPVAVGLVMTAVPVAVSSAAETVTVTGVQASSPLTWLTTPKKTLPVGAPAGSVNVIEVPSAETAVTVISVAPTVVSDVFR